MIARVRSVMAASMASGSMLESSLTSANTILAPTSEIAAAEAKNELGAVITSSPGPTPMDRSTRWSEQVPLATPVA